MAVGPHRRRVAVALTFSFALHAGIAVWVAQLRPTAPPPLPAPIEVEVIAQAPRPEPVRPPPQAPVIKHVRPSPPVASAPRPPSTPVVAPPPDRPVRTRAEPDDVPRAVALVPSSSFALPALPAAMPDAGIPSVTARLTPSPDAIVRSIATETIARGKVDRGLVHPYFRDVGNALMKAWDAERAVAEKGLPGFLQKTTEDARTWGRIWMAQAEKFGTGGNPAGDAPLVASRAMDGTAAASDALRRQRWASYKEGRRALIRVVQDRGGRILSVELIAPSRNAEVDKAAVADVRAAAERMPPPPPEAIGDHPTLTSTWEFELVVSITPPIPSMSFEFDETRGFVDPRLPLDRRIYKKIRLVAAE